MDEKFQEMISDIKEIQPFFYGNIAEMFIAKGYRKESDTAREILTELKPIIINYLEEYMENGSEEAPKYFESLCKKYGVVFTNSLEKGGDKNGKTSSRS